MEISIFIFYLLLAFVFISIIPFYKKSGIGRGSLLCLFSIKVLAGVAYGKFYTLPKYYPGSDTWRFYRLSLEETKWILQDPIAFIKDLFVYGYSRPGNLFSGENTYWNDLKSNIPIKIMAVMNVFTNNSYYTNIILFNFLFLFGLVALFKLFLKLFPGKKWTIISGIFLLPSTLFWCSGIHKDGLILSTIGIIIYTFEKGIKEGFSIKKSLLILICFLLIFSLRNYVFFLLVPALFCWWFSSNTRIRTSVVFLVIYLLGIVLLFIIPYIFPSINFPEYLTIKQQEFLLLTGDSEVKTSLLLPTFKSFIYFFPQALDMAFFRPHLTESKNIAYIPAIFETIILILLIIVSTVFSSWRRKLTPMIWFFFSFSISVLLVCGYTIPFVGAIVRYRSLILPLLITPLLCMTDFSFLKNRNYKYFT